MLYIFLEILILISLSSEWNQLARVLDEEEAHYTCSHAIGLRLYWNLIGIFINLPALPHSHSFPVMGIIYLIKYLFLVFFSYTWGKDAQGFRIFYNACTNECQRVFIPLEYRDQIMELCPNFSFANLHMCIYSLVFGRSLYFSRDLLQWGLIFQNVPQITMLYGLLHVSFQFYAVWSDQLPSFLLICGQKFDICILINEIFCKILIQILSNSLPQTSRNFWTFKIYCYNFFYKPDIRKGVAVISQNIRHLWRLPKPACFLAIVTSRKFIWCLISLYVLSLKHSISSN